MSRLGHMDSTAPSARARLVFVWGGHAVRACRHGVPAPHSLASLVARGRYDSGALSPRERVGVQPVNGVSAP